MRVCVWSPLPPSPSGIADYVAEALPSLAGRLEVLAVVEEPEAVEPGLRAAIPVVAPDEAAGDLHLYHLGNSPPHAYVARACRERPGVVFLHDWSLHHLVLHETVERGDVAAYLREMRRSHGTRGTFVGRQVARALGGDLLPASFPLNDRVLESSLAVVGLSRWLVRRVSRAVPGRPLLHLPHHFSSPLDPVPGRGEARAALGLPPDALVVTSPGLATASKELPTVLRAVAALAPRHPALRLVVAGGVDPKLPLPEWAAAAGVADRLQVTGRLSLEDFVRHLSASDVVVALRFPSHGEMSGAVVRALGVGRPVLVTAGTPVAEEFPEGVVVGIDPGPRRERELVAVLGHLLERPAARETLGRMAREHAAAHHGLEATVDALAAFLLDIHARQGELLRAVEASRNAEGGLLGFYLDEARAAARSLGLLCPPDGLRSRLAPLADPEARP